MNKRTVGFTLCTLAAAAFVVTLMVESSLQAKPGPGLGVFTGAKFNASGDWDPSHNFGFFVDIPLVQTFHITPSADTYTIADAAVTDLSLAFKFVVPLRFMRPYAAISPGITTYGNERDIVLAGSVGSYFKLVANLDLLVQAEYKRMMTPPEGELATEKGSIHGQLGILFRF